MKVLRVLAVSVVAVAVSACGSIHPGDAAVVGGDSISVSDVDELAEVYCSSELTQAAGAAPQQLDNAAIRRAAVITLVKEQISRELVEDRRLAVDEQLAQVSGDVEAQLRELFPADADDVIEVYASSQRHLARLVALGSDSTGQVANEAIIEQLATAGDEIVVAAFEDFDVEFSPRFGIDDAGASAGSLSVAAPDDTPVVSGDLPAPVGCGA